MAGRFFANLNSFPVTLPNIRGGQRTVNPNEVVEGDWWSKLCGNRQLTEIDPGKYTINGRKIVQGQDIRRSKATRPPIRDSRVNALDNPTRVKSKRLSKVQTLADDVCQTGCEQSCEGACELDIQGIEEFEHMRGVGDLYFCKYCDYNSPVKTDVDKHLDKFHANIMNPEGDGTEDVAGEVVETKDPVNEDGDIVITEEVDNTKIEKVDNKLTNDIDDNSRFDEPTEPEANVGIVEETEDYTANAAGEYTCKECGKVYKGKTAKSWLAKHINSKHR